MRRAAAPATGPAAQPYSAAPPARRLAAFYAAMTDLLEQHIHLTLGAESGSARFATGAYGFWRAHVRMLVKEAGVPGPDALSDILLVPLEPELFAYQRGRGRGVEEIKSALGTLAERTPAAG